MLLYLITGAGALGALGTGDHHPLDGSWLETHRTDVITGVVAFTTLRGATAIKLDDLRFAVTHPGEALKQTYRTTKTTEEVAGKDKFNQ